MARMSCTEPYQRLGELGSTETWWVNMVNGSASPDHATVRLATTVPLLDLVPGTVAVLRQVLDDESRAVLRSLGLTDGARLRICRLGDPCIIQVRSTRIGLSKVVARSIHVAVIERDMP